MIRLSLFCTLVASTIVGFAQNTVDPSLYEGMRWRLIGPFRGGKATMAVGVPGNPAIYYFGTAGSGVWKTDDGGQVWNCVSDSVRLTNIGAVAVAPSSPDTVYVGAAGVGPSTGLYRSKDGGGHWDHVALQGHAVASIVIDPHNPDLVMAAAGDLGVVRSSDGGRNWTSVLPDAQVGGVWLVFDPDDPRNVYVGTRPIPTGGRGGGGGGGGGGAGRGAAPVKTPATDSQIYRSRDEGATWTKVSPDGLPGGNFGTIALAVAPGTKGLRVYNYVAQGMFRSDDGGEHWRRASEDPRLIGGGQFHDVLVDPKNANIIFATQTSLYRSTDAGATWESYTGAPSGADFNFVWIDPTNDNNMILAVDQGTEISMNGGKTFTTWFNQPTGQFYNVTTDHGFPFFMYAAQQDSGTVATPIFGRGGQITYRDWYTTNGFETARIVPDPADSNYLYATGWYGSILRINKVTGQTQHVFERTPKYREAGSPPMGFSPLDPNMFYLATQYLLATRDHGMTWQTMSPDLTAGTADEPIPPDSSGRAATQRGGGPAISSLAFAAKDAKQIWAGTTTGHIHLTRDGGKNWSSVGPEGLTQGRAGARTIAAIEASPSEPARAFALIGGAAGGQRGAATDAPPRVFRTDDFGRTWKTVNSGLPNSVAWAIREDPENRNLVFAALDAGVFVSFNGGDSWQSLELNLPAAWCRDLAIEQNNLIVATYGRAIWALDDISPLRQLTSKAGQVAASDAFLFSPTPSIRMQWDTYTDTPLGPEVAAAQNPPDGAIIDYYLRKPAANLKMEIFDQAGKLVRTYSSEGSPSLGYKVNVPDYWLVPAPLLSKSTGLHRFVWDLRYPDPDELLYTYYGVHVNYFEYTLADHAIPRNTPWHEPQGPMVLPGQYELRLTVDGKVFKQNLTVKLDPRLHFSNAELQRQLDLAQKLSANMNATYRAYNQVAQLRQELTASLDALKRSQSNDAAVSAAEALDAKAEKLTDGAGPPAGIGPIHRDLTRLLIAVDQSDSPPAAALLESYEGMCQNARTVLSAWNELRMHDVPALNVQLKRTTTPPLSVPQAVDLPDCGK
jgi:photosystem II stability/assembly factor-like uncharacterized protein